MYEERKFLEDKYDPSILVLENFDQEIKYDVDNLKEAMDEL